jgi:hypothetical protein
METPITIPKIDKAKWLKVKKIYKDKKSFLLNDLADLINKFLDRKLGVK